MARSARRETRSRVSFSFVLAATLAALGALCFDTRHPALADDPPPSAPPIDYDLDLDGVPDLGYADPEFGHDPPAPGFVVAFSGADESTLWLTEGEHPDDAFGLASALLADIDADGAPEILVAAPLNQRENPAFTGRAYVLSGATGDPIRTHDGAPGESFAVHVAFVPDRDADGVADYAVYGTTADDLDRGLFNKHVYSAATGALLYTLTLLQEDYDAGLTPADVNHDGLVDVGDVAQVIGALGETGSDLPEDVSDDALVDAADVALTVSQVGQTSAMPLDQDGQPWPNLTQTLSALCRWLLQHNELLFMRLCSSGGNAPGGENETSPGGADPGDVGNGDNPSPGGNGRPLGSDPGGGDDPDDACRCSWHSASLEGPDVVSPGESFTVTGAIGEIDCTTYFRIAIPRGAELLASVSEGNTALVAGEQTGFIELVGYFHCTPDGPLKQRVEKTIFIAGFDLDIDSDNTNDADAPDRDDVEEAAEDAEPDDAHPGKVILVNSWDADADGVEDFLDGYDLNPLLDQDDAIDGGRFTPLVLEAVHVPDGARLTLSYNAADPLTVTLGEHGWETEGSLRIWLLDAGEPRDPRPVPDGGDFVAPGEYAMSDLLLAGGEEVTLYVEAVNPSAAVADQTISVAMDLHADGQWVVTDTVRLTAVKVELLGKGPGENKLRPTCLIATNLFDSTDPPEPGQTEGAVMTHLVRVTDPREEIEPSFVLDGIPVFMTRTGGAWTTPEFYITVPPSPANPASGLDALHVPINTTAQEVDWEYSAGGGEFQFRDSGSTGKTRRVAVEATSQAEKQIAKVLREVVEDLEAAGWAAPPGADAGAYGDKVHADVFAKISSKPRWHASVWVDSVTKEILSIGAAPQGTDDLVEIDALRVKSGYTLVVGETLDVTRVEGAFEIKTSARGYVDAEKKLKMTRVFGQENWRSMTPARMWKSGIGWIDHPIGAKLFRYLNMLGLAYSAYAVCHADAHEDDLDEMLKKYDQAMAPGLSDIERDGRAIVLFEATRVYLSHFGTDDVATQAVFLGMFYEYLATAE